MNPPETRCITEWIAIFQMEECGGVHADVRPGLAMAHFNEFLARYGELPAKVTKHSRQVTAPISELTTEHIKRFLTWFVPQAPRADVGDEWYVPTLARFIQQLKDDGAISDAKHKDLLSALTGVGTEH